MIAINKYGDIGSIRKHNYACPHCGQSLPTRKLYRKHLNVHRRKEVLTHFDRAGISNRVRKLKVTLAGKDKA